MCIMIIEQIYTGCLAQGAYFIASNGEAAIIDPLREVKPYLDKAEKAGARIKYIFETHFHADFVSGHIDLSRATGAPIVYGPQATPSFEALIATDGQVFQIGKLTLQVLHTPGHTLESSCYLLKDEAGVPVALFSGDTLFLGDVGRPDLAQKSNELTMEDLAGMLYDSLTQKILPLPDSIMVYPAHGAGSACGKNMMKETMDTLGNQKKMNYALNQPNKKAFTEAVLDGLSAPPAYFPLNVNMNKHGYDSFGAVMERGLIPLTADRFEAAVENTGAVVIDTRAGAEFAKGFVPRSINIGLKGDFAPWAGAVLGDVTQPVLLVCDPGSEAEVITRLARVGIDQVLGYLNGGFSTWLLAGKEVDTVTRISAQDFVTRLGNKPMVIDVRRDSEYAAQHVEDAYHRSLAEFNSWMPLLDRNQAFVLHCQSGYRSMIAASIFLARGYRNFVEVEGGFKAIAEAGAPTTDFMCQSKVAI